MENENNQKSSPLRGTFVEGQNVCPKGGEGLEGLLPRGLRNNNPLNIRHSKSKWKGMRKVQTDSAFVQFETMAYGYRAAFVLLRTYRVKYGYNTIRKIISRWAPASENNTERYIQNVSQWTGIDPDKLIAGQDANAMIQIVAAMSRMENGRPSLPFGHLTHTDTYSESTFSAFRLQRAHSTFTFGRLQKSRRQKCFPTSPLRGRVLIPLVTSLTTTSG